MEVQKDWRRDGAGKTGGCSGQDNGLFCPECPPVPAGGTACLFTDAARCAEV